MFPYIDAKDVLKSNFSYLAPGQAPYYWILACLELSLFKAAFELNGLSWWITAGVIGLFMLACVERALTQVCETPEQAEISQLRVARIVGASTPFVSLAIVMSRTKLDETLLLTSLAIACIQSAVFLFLVHEEKLEKGKSVNIPQLLVICTTLLFFVHASIASLTTREYLLTIPKELIRGYGQSIDESSVRDWPKQLHVQEKVAKFALKDEAGPIDGGFYGIAFEIGQNSGVHEHHIDDAAYQSKNFLALSIFLGLLWVVTLARIVRRSIFLRSWRQSPNPKNDT